MFGDLRQPFDGLDHSESPEPPPHHTADWRDGTWGASTFHVVLHNPNGVAFGINLDHCGSPTTPMSPTGIREDETSPYPAPWNQRNDTSVAATGKPFSDDSVSQPSRCTETRTDYTCDLHAPGTQSCDSSGLSGMQQFSEDSGSQFHHCHEARTDRSLAPRAPHSQSSYHNTAVDRQPYGEGFASHLTQPLGVQQSTQQFNLRVWNTLIYTPLDRTEPPGPIFTPQQDPHPPTNRFACVHKGCGRSYSQQSKLTYAISIYLLIRSLTKALRKHMKSHRPKSERPYRCTFDGCNGAFNESKDLVRHRETRRHSETSQLSPESERTCSVQSCRRVLSRKDNLLRHERKSHPHLPKTGQDPA